MRDGRIAALLAAVAAACALAGAVAADVVSESFGVAANATATHPGTLTIARGAGGSVAAADLSSIPAEAKVYHASLIALRAGLHNGNLSYGAGIHLLILDLSAAVSNIEEWTPTGPQQKQLFSLAAAISF